MKIINLFKSIPFLFTLILLIFISINNQNKKIRLNILIWNTPSLSLGTYLAISTGAGYVLSYIVTTNIAKVNNSKLEYKNKYTLNRKEEETNLYQESDKKIVYDNTLIDRDLKDPSPTINANFRVIGKINKKNQTNQNNQQIEFNNSELTDETEYQYEENLSNYKNNNGIKPILNDWEDDTYSNW